MNHEILNVEANRGHVWGEYKEVLVDDNHILRSVRIYEDSYNSLHSHPVDEVQLVESWEIRYHFMEDGVLKTCELVAGSVTFVPAGIWHRIEFINGDFEEFGVKFAQISEIVLGSHDDGRYPIDRLDPAKPWKAPTRISM